MDKFKVPSTIESQISSIFIHKRVHYWQFAINIVKEEHQFLIVLIVAFNNFERTFIGPFSTVFPVGFLTETEICLISLDHIHYFLFRVLLLKEPASELGFLFLVRVC